MFISYAASAANGFKKWSEAHPAAKYAPRSDKAAAIAQAVSDTGSPSPGSATSSQPTADPQFSPIHVRRAMGLRETAEAAAIGSPLRARLLDLALQYDRMAANARHGSAEARRMCDE